jgi:hypothetical protein
MPIAAREITLRAGQFRQMSALGGRESVGPVL